MRYGRPECPESSEGSYTRAVQALGRRREAYTARLVYTAVLRGCEGGEPAAPWPAP